MVDWKRSDVLEAYGAWANASNNCKSLWCHGEDYSFQKFISKTYVFTERGDEIGLNRMMRSGCHPRRLEMQRGIDHHFGK